MTLMTNLEDRLIRRKTALHEVPLDRYQVTVAHHREDYEDAFRLVHACYAVLGIESLGAPSMHMASQHAVPESNVIVARHDGALVGTVTTTLDSPAGLPLEKDYAESIEQLRADGARLVEWGNFAIVARHRHHGLSLLFMLASIQMSRQVLDGTHVVIGIHPKAAPVYRALWGFEPLGNSQDHASLNAPVIGMVVRLVDLEARARQWFNKPLRSGFLVSEHLAGVPLPGVELPLEREMHDLVRWKLPRETFRALFANGDCQLERRTVDHLKQCRTHETLMGIVDLESISEVATMS